MKQNVQNAQKEQKMTLIGVFIGLLGLVTLAFGLADIFVWAGISPGFQVGILAITGDDFFRWVWGGFIMVCAGLFMLVGCTRVTTLQQSAKVVLGGVLVWLIAGTDLFARLCAGIPADASSPAFFNSLSGFLAAFAPPYTPAVLILPFTPGILYLIWLQDADDS